MILIMLKSLIIKILNVFTMERKLIYTWNAPEGYWYTQRTLELESERMFWKEIRSKNPNAIDRYVLWTDEQKAEWESVWLSEPENQ